jgi:ABC-type dipeptide/oligopeptide/nickel transport system permease subunit
MSKFLLFRSRLAFFGMVMTLIVIIFSVLGPFIAPYPPSEFTSDILHPPSKAHLLGSDAHGRDLLSRMLRGGRITLSLAFSTMLICSVFGTLFGMLAAYIPGFFGNLINRAIDFIMSFPSIMTALIVLAIVTTGGTTPIVLAIAFALVPRFARVVRGATLPILQEDYLLAEKALGASHIRILGVHILHNLIAPIIVLTSIYLPYVIMLESSLSFLGLGAPPEIPTWGRIIADGKVYMQIAPWLTIFPGLAILFTSLGFNLLGDGLRDILDPKSATRLYKK